LLPPRIDGAGLSGAATMLPRRSVKIPEDES